MKHVVVIVALLILGNPLFPVVEYVVKYNYIANELCVNRNKPMLHCNGKCHLKKALAKKATEETDNSKQADFKKTELLILFTMPMYESAYNLVEELSNKQVIYTLQKKYCFLLYKQCLKPPIVA